MHHFAVQVTLISALLLRINAQAFYDQRATSHLGTPNIKIIKVEQPSIHGTGGQLLILQGQHHYQGLHLTPHVVAFEKIAATAATAAQHYGSTPPHYTQYPTVHPQEHYRPPAPKYDHGKPQQPQVIVVKPTTSYSPSKHVSLYDVKLPVQGPHFNPHGLHESVTTIPKSLKDELRPDIDVRSSNPSKAMRSGEEDPKIVFPQQSQDTDDSVEVFAPLREQRDVQISLEPVVRTLYPYAIQPVVKYPQQY